MGTIVPSEADHIETDLPFQAGKVFIVTGANTGIGLELARILFVKEGTVYLTGRSTRKVDAAITQLEKEFRDSTSKGQLRSLFFDLADLTTIVKAVNTFLKQETRLEVLFNNAEIAQVPPGSVSAQGYEGHMGTNCLGPSLLTKLLLPILTATAKTASRGSVRVIFTSSSIVDLGAPARGLDLDKLAPSKHGNNKAKNYAPSKPEIGFSRLSSISVYGAKALCARRRTPG